jgi:hypothetical protein
MADNSSVNKRRRTVTNSCLSINDIPDALMHVAHYLSKPQQALFAIALYTHHQTPTDRNSSSTSSSEWVPNTTSNAIISATSREQWQELDFSEIEKGLAAKLTDDHVRSILRCVGAPTNLKTLKLAGCVNITGNCLDVMRDTALENIDISLVGMYESPRIDPEPHLSENILFPILDSIIGRGSLKLLQLPWKFRNEPTIEMEQFLLRYEQYLAAFRYKCSKCDILCRETGWGAWMYINNDMRGEAYFGTQNYTCHQCLNYYCLDGDCQDDDGNYKLRYCVKCNKEYCKNCVSQWKQCGRCGKEFCNGCIKAIKMKECDREDCTNQLCEECTKTHTCSYCNRTRCLSCATSHQCSRDECTKIVCDDCVGSKGEGGKCYSDSCRKAFCSAECQFLECEEDGETTCVACAKAAASFFRNKCQEQKEEMEQLKEMK